MKLEARFARRSKGAISLQAGGGCNGYTLTITADCGLDQKTQIREKETEIASQMSESGAEAPLDPKVIKVFTTVGEILSKYRSGKLPKAFKIIPSLRNWEDILYGTNPDGWTAAAMCVTRSSLCQSILRLQCVDAV